MPKPLKALGMSFGLCLLMTVPALSARAQNAAGLDSLNFLDETARRGGLYTPDADGAGRRDDVIRIIGNILNAILGFVGIIFFVQVLWAGIRWMTAGGNDEVVKESKSTLKVSVIGIAIALSAFIITNFVLVQVRNVINAAP